MTVRIELIVNPIAKLLSITSGKLRVDCGDPGINETLYGYYNVVSGYGYFLSFRVDRAGSFFEASTENLDVVHLNRQNINLVGF